MTGRGLPRGRTTPAFGVALAVVLVGLALMVAGATAGGVAAAGADAAAAPAASALSPADGAWSQGTDRRPAQAAGGQHDIASAATEGAISGAVTDQDGKPVGGATVEVYHVQSGTTAFVVTTYDDGTFGTQKVRGGTYQVTVTKEDYGSFTSSFQVEDGETYDLNASLEAPEGRLRGEVRLQDNSPFGNTTVEVIDDERGTVVRTMTVREDGTFGPEQISVGTYRVRVPEEGYTTYSTTNVLEANETEKIFVTMERKTGTLEGSVADGKGDPVARATVAVLDPDDGTVVERLTSQPNGSFGPVELPTGTYEITAEASGYAGDSVTVSVGHDERVDVVTRLVATPTATPSPTASPTPRAASTPTDRGGGDGQSTATGDGGFDVSISVPGFGFLPALIGAMGAVLLRRGLA